MAAVVTKPVVASRPPPFIMPKCNLGERIIFHPNADRNAAPQYGEVVEVNGCDVNIRLHTFHGFEIKVNVCHVDDPRLEKNMNVRPNGSWEFHPDTVLLRDLAERVKVLEELK